MADIVDLKPGDRVLISRTDKLGDLILALPFVQTLKKRYPECSIEVLTSLYASPILENNPAVDKIVRVQNDQLIASKLYKKDLLHRIKMNEYAAVVVLYPERRVSQLFYKANIPVRIGTARRFHSVYFNRHIFHSRKTNRKHEYQYNLDFLEYFAPGETDHFPRVYPTEKEIRNARRILAEKGIDAPFVVIHPGSGGSAENWSVPHFAELYEKLRQAGVQAVVTGSEAEGMKLDTMELPISQPMKKITGETDLRTLAAVLSLASVVVANSTGPLHLAVSVGTRVVGLYPSKRIMSPRRWGPLGNGNHVLQPVGVVCRCPDQHCRCMETITPELVARKVQDILQEQYVG